MSLECIAHLVGKGGLVRVDWSGTFQTIHRDLKSPADIVDKVRQPHMLFMKMQYYSLKDSGDGSPGNPIITFGQTLGVVVIGFWISLSLCRFGPSWLHVTNTITTWAYHSSFFSTTTDGTMTQS